MAATQNSVHGVIDNEDLDPALIARDTRSFRQKLRSFKQGGGSGFGLVVIGILTIVLPVFGFPGLLEVLCVVGALYWLFICKGEALAAPYRVRMKKTNKKTEGEGILYLGNALDNNAELNFSNDDARTHLLVFGSTGSGKTRFLLGLLYQSMLFGSGCMYVDGKGDNTVLWLVYSFCRRLNRQDDLLVINYLTGDGSSKTSSDPRDRYSNTTNPLAHGSGEQLRSLIVGLMREAGGDGDMWKGMASAMMGGLLNCLVHMRDTGELNLDVSTVRYYLPLDKIVKLAQRQDLPESAIGPISRYLAELPGYKPEDAKNGRLGGKVYEQHGYRIMMFSEVLSELEETYGHIFSAPLGEVDFKDVVYNRRILFVMLPAIEKDSDALAGLGKMIVAGVRAALAPALGYDAQGRRSEVIEKKPTTSPVPFIMILDEYGYYSVKGFAVVAAQARSLGVCVAFAGQDYPSFKRGSEQEAQATIANTNIKVGMKVEEEETAKIITGRGGKGSKYVTGGAEKAAGVGSSYRDGDQARIEEKDRINLRDLVQQKPGQAHVIYGDTIVRAQLFYAQPTEVEEAYLNDFLMIDGPPKSRLDSLRKTQGKFNELLETSVAEQDGFPTRGTDRVLKALFSDMSMCLSRRLNMSEAAITSIGLAEWRQKEGDEALRKKAAESKKDEVEEIYGLGSDWNAEAEVDLDGPANESQTISRAEVSAAPPEKTEEDERELERLNALLSKTTTESISGEAQRDSERFTGMLAETIRSAAARSSDAPLTSEQRKNIGPMEQVMAIEERAGATEEQAKSRATRAMNILGSRVSYPDPPTPQKDNPKDITDALKVLAQRVSAIKS